ncbi:21747_t:CDS:2 [Cetraspora pellucida]|uniref:21747_t:CDS:1 n=1 Tax=Cetraspora pellucida TaxID=1433469 RepID=A0A9N9E924_9GLOM|nr:21747_t:CDS:2 [Cetraspora pellucida]
MDSIPLSQKRFSNSKRPYFTPRFSPPTELHEEYYRKINIHYSPPLIPNSSFNAITNKRIFPMSHYQNTETSDNVATEMSEMSDTSYLKTKNDKIFRKTLKNKLRKEINNYKADLKTLSNERDKISNCYVAIATLERMIKTKNPSNGFREGVYEVLKALSTNPGDNMNLTNQIISTMLEIIIKIWQDKGFGRCAICKFGVVIESTSDVNNLWDTPSWARCTFPTLIDIMVRYRYYG